MTTFGDYREMAGVLIAHSIEISVKGRPRRIRVVVEKIEIDPALDDARFRMPEGTASTRFLTSPSSRVNSAADWALRGPRPSRPCCNGNLPGCYFRRRRRLGHVRPAGHRMRSSLQLVAETLPCLSTT